MEPGAGRTFAEVVRTFRESRSLTQDELAERAGLTVKAVGALERGERRRPFPHTVRALADALRLDDADRAALVASVPTRARATTATTVPAPSRPADPALSVATTSPLIGREDDLAAVVDLFARGHRVVTLTGPGGVGKTRLALETVSRHGADLADHAVVVEVSALRDPAAVLPRVATALGIAEDAGDITAPSLAAALAGRRLLILLDNLEHLLGASSALADLVARAPDLLLLVTSRAPMRIRSERELVIGPLSLPGDDSPAAAAASPAVAMFLDRADASGAPAPRAAEHAATLTAICRRLDGLPLALELAAAWVGVLGPSALLERLDRGLPDVAPRDLPERQRTLTAALDWSHELLAPGEQALFAQLAVFTDGFSLDSVEAVARVDDDVVAGVRSLVEQSLVSRTPGPGDRPRFRLLEPVRQYAVARLQASGLALATADRHADHAHATALAARDALTGPDLVGCLDRLEADHANLRSGFLRLVETGRADDAAGLVASVWLYLATRGHARDGLRWLARLDPDGLGDVGRCRAATAAAGLMFVTGDIAGMRARGREAVTLARGLDAPSLHAEAAILAGHAAVFTLEEDAAAEVLAEARQVTSSSGDRWAGAHALLGQGQLALLRGQLDVADDLLRAAEQEARVVGNAFTLSATLNRRATVTALRGDHPTTAALLAESVEVSVAARIGWTLTYALPALAGVALALHRGESAAFLFGATASLSIAHAADPRFPVSSRLSRDDLAAARDQLDDETFRRSWDSGRVAMPADIAELARQLSAHALR